MARIAPAHGGGAAAERIRSMRSGRLSPLYAMLLHSETVAEAWCTFGGAVRFSTALNRRLFELVACMVVRVTGADYEWKTHSNLALDEGVTRQQLDALPEWHNLEVFSVQERTLLQYVERILEGEVTDSVHHRASEHFTPQELVEVAVTTCYFVAVARFTQAFGVEP